MADENDTIRPIAIVLAEAVKAWWEDHKYDTTSVCGEEHNVYHKEPPFVTIAKQLIGDWEKSIFLHLKGGYLWAEKLKEWHWISTGR